MQEVDDHMDLEMQIPASPSADNDDRGGSSTRQIIRTAIVVVQSVQKFLAGTNQESPRVSRVSSSKSVDCNPQDDENVSSSISHPRIHIFVCFTGPHQNHPHPHPNVYKN